MTRTSFSRGRITSAPTEYDLIYDRGHYPGRSEIPIVFCHGSGENATTTMSNPYSNHMMNVLARRNKVVAGDFGGQTWGNDTAISRIDEAVSYVGGSAILIGASMGACSALNYTRAHPTKVLAVAGIIPLLDLSTLISLGYTAQINAAYPPAYDDEVHGPTHSPVQYAQTLPEDLPIALWTSSNDPLALPSTADEFVSLRPQTERFNLGPQGHNGALSTDSLAAWIRLLTY